MVLPVILAVVTFNQVIVNLDGGSSAQASLGAMGEVRAQSRKGLAKDIGLHPERLLIIRGQDVKLILREPELVRSESPTTIWQYRTDSCVLDIYFAGDQDPLLSPVAHYEVRARAKDVSDEAIAATCVRDLARAKGRPRMVDVSALYKRN